LPRPIEKATDALGYVGRALPGHPVLSPRNDDELRKGNEFFEALRVSEGEVALALSPENEHRAPDLLVVRGQSGQQALSRVC
jgi:hypothetical protein